MWPLRSEICLHRGGGTASRSKVFPGSIRSFRFKCQLNQMGLLSSVWHASSAMQRQGGFVCHSLLWEVTPRCKATHRNIPWNTITDGFLDFMTRVNFQLFIAKKGQEVGREQLKQPSKIHKPHTHKVTLFKWLERVSWESRIREWAPASKM